MITRKSKEWYGLSTDVKPVDYGAENVDVFYDVLNEDGTLYLAASDPIPVYE